MSEEQAQSILEAEFWTHYSPIAKNMMEGDFTKALWRLEQMQSALEDVVEQTNAAESPSIEVCA